MYNFLGKILLLLLSTLFTILGFMYGWGLRPMSWKWIIGMTLCQCLIVLIMAWGDMEDSRDPRRRG